MKGLHEGNIKNQKQAFKDELLRLMTANPDLELKFFVTSEEVSCDFYYSEQSIQSVEVSGWCEYNDRIFTDGCELSDEIYVTDDDISHDYALERASEMMAQVILVRLGA